MPASSATSLVRRSVVRCGASAGGTVARRHFRPAHQPEAEPWPVDRANESGLDRRPQHDQDHPTNRHCAEHGNGGPRGSRARRARKGGQSRRVVLGAGRAGSCPARRRARCLRLRVQPTTRVRAVSAPRHCRHPDVAKAGKLDRRDECVADAQAHGGPTKGRWTASCCFDAAQAFTSVDPATRTDDLLADADFAGVDAFAERASSSLRLGNGGQRR
jgi:hypothetical protein